MIGYIVKNIKKSLGALLVCALLSGCSSDEGNAVKTLSPGGLTINDKAIYLGGEMNDYEASETYRLRKDGHGYCTLATLRSDWAPYKFKFADENWSKGTNFGFLTPPGVLRDGARSLELNPNSKFEEISYYPKKDGVYRFCLIPKNDRYYVTVTKSSKKELPSMAQLIDMSRSDFE